MMKQVKFITLLSLIMAFQSVPLQAAQSNVVSAQNLSELLSIIKQQRDAERKAAQQREQVFLRAKQEQSALLEQARKQHAATQQKLVPLKADIEANKKSLEALSEKVDAETQSLGDLKASFNEFAGSFSASLRSSMVTPSLPERQAELNRLAAMQTFPAVADLESLWMLVQEEMIRGGEIVQYQANVVDVQGLAREHTILRGGTFTSFTDGQFLRYIPETEELLIPVRQPSQSMRKRALEFSQSPHQQSSMVIDPTQGSLLGMLSIEPDIAERIKQAGTIGLIIIALGAAGLLLTLWRVIYLLWVSGNVRRQMKKISDPSPGNPLGRVLLQAQQFSTRKEENLEFKLDEAVLVELPKLERGHNFIKLLAAVAPLLGLLGTVTGMILTFQSISLFGNGDPKLMAGGISQALMTTVLGLVAAIPLLFGHSFVSSLARNLIQRLDEQSAGMLAKSLEDKEH